MDLGGMDVGGMDVGGLDVGGMVKRRGTALVVIAIVIAVLTVAGISAAPAASRHRHGHRASSGVQGVVTAGPVCPVEPFPPVPQCADRHVPAHLTLQRGSNGPVVARGDAGNDGRFRITAVPGRYTLSATSPNAMRCTSQPVTVTSGQFTDVQVGCDTGIR
jgi:hypothetical protein